MSTFNCPQCGQISEYDEWSSTATCLHCGFEPPAGEQMIDYLRDLDPPTQSGSSEQTDKVQESGGITRFLPQSGRSFLAGLGWGLLAFAIVMLFSSLAQLSGSVARCLGLTVLVLVTFAVWQLYARSENLGVEQAEKGDERGS